MSLLKSSLDNTIKKVEEIIKESIKSKEDLLKDHTEAIARAADEVVKCIREGGKIIVFGNGGSAADSQHIAAEFMGRFKKERKALPAIALTTNTSTLTAISNDYGYDLSFCRQLEGIGAKGDVALGISTSGNAKNVNEAISAANQMGLITIGLTGKDGGQLARTAQFVLKVPSNNTPRIQELHITIGHIICELVEEKLEAE